MHACHHASKSQNVLGTVDCRRLDGDNTSSLTILDLSAFKIERSTGALLQSHAQVCVRDGRRDYEVCSLR